MKALVFKKYGAPSEVLRLEERPRPVPAAHEVLVKVHATAVNDYDWSMVRGQPYLYRLLFGLRKPSRQVPGMEVSGTVEALGKNVSALEVGDAVYGDISEYSFGTFAEYACVHEKALARKPAGMSFEEAAAIPHASLLAYQGLAGMGGIQQGQQVLINGAGGGVGAFGLQLAKLYDAEVTGVDAGEKLERMKSAGFDHVIDYKKEDFTRNGRRYDLILDAKTARPPLAYTRSLKPGGKYVTVGGTPARLLQLLAWKPWIAAFTSKSVHILALKPNQGLEHIGELFEAGRIRAVIDGPYALSQGAEALRRFGEGKHYGKVVIAL
ncbi:MAG: NAD(P)-dependent alcohol dehydrogenase [Lewinellaceae bacterium]|nr:NAD(P)-dependent alcohol dehydrogenase [Lewinellaceae bacterium]